MKDSSESFPIRTQDRIVGLDILRSIAILWVVYLHGTSIIPPEYRTTYLIDYHFTIFDGVSMFFVLSGFLIGRILLRLINSTEFTLEDLYKFWIRRWFRTLPNYYLILGVLATYASFKSSDSHGFNYSYLFFCQNIWKPHPNFFSEAWSLCVEEWFYLLYPLSCYLFHKFSGSKGKAILYPAFLFLAAPLLLRFIKYQIALGDLDLDSEFRKPTPLRLDSLIYGILAAYLNFNYPQFWIQQRKRLAFISLTLAFGFAVGKRYNWGIATPLQFNCESIIICCLLPFLSQYKTTRVKTLDSFFIIISTISYSMYLLHFHPIQVYLLPKIILFLTKTGLPVELISTTRYILYWGLTFIFSYILYRLFESPMTRLRDRFSQ